MTGIRTLTDRERALLEFETAHANTPSDGTKQAAIRAQLAMSDVAYYQQLNRLLDDHAALAAFPQLVYRLRRIRDSRTARNTLTRAR
jgi:hypothetical protein